ncbi:MAG: rod shape-determining protein MreC [Pelistega sp.]|nr:rod shape-determining protein MreC [Pelistega sp.]
MQQEKSLRLFKRGQVSGVGLVFWAVLCIVLMVVDSQTQVLAPVRQAASTIITPLQKAALWPRDVVVQISNWSNAVELAKIQTEEAQRQRIGLTQLNVQASQMAAENAQLRRLLGIKNSVTIPSVAVEILYTAANPLHQTLVLTKGANDGIAPGMPLIGEGGIVGQIQRVTASTAEAALITDERITMPAIVLRNGLRVVVYGSGRPGRVEVRYLALGADIQEGDQLVTSGIGGVYPAGLAIGRVSKIENNSAQGFVSALVEPSAHPERYLHFLVLLTEATNPQSDAELETNQ